MYRDPVLNIPALYEWRQLAQLVLRDDRPCLNSNLLDVADALGEVPVLSAEQIARHRQAIGYPAGPRAKFSAVGEMAREVAEQLASRDATHGQAAGEYLAGLDEVAQLRMPPASLEPPEVMRLGIVVVENLASRLEHCQLALIHGSLARGQIDGLSDVDADFFFEPGPDRAQVRRAAEEAGPIREVSVGLDDLNFRTEGVEFQCDLWHLGRIEQYLAGWPAFEVGWPWDYLCEQLPEALFVAGDRGLFEQLRATVAEPPRALKESLFAGQMQGCRQCLERMSGCRERRDAGGFFAAMNARVAGWVWHWAKCRMIACGRFIDVPKGLVSRVDALAGAPAGAAGRLQEAFSLDLSAGGMHRIEQICRDLTDRTRL